MAGCSGPNRNHTVIKFGHPFTGAQINHKLIHTDTSGHGIGDTFDNDPAL